MQMTFGNGNDDFASHDLAFHMGVGIILASAVVPILAYRFVRREFFKPRFVIVVQAAFVVVDEHRGGDMHGIDEAKPLLDSALFHQVLNGGGDVDEASPFGDFEPKLFRKTIS